MVRCLKNIRIREKGVRRWDSKGQQSGMNALN
jgi:hypothetical protein